MSVKVTGKVAKGGLILTPQTKTIPGGAAAEMLNYEVDVGGGYRRIDGYERFDGRTPPSSGWRDPWSYDLSDGGTSPGGVQWEAVEPVVGNLNEAVTLCIPLNGLSLIGGITMAPGGEFALLVHDGNQAHYTEQVYVSQQDFLDAIVAMPGVASAEVTDGSLCVTSDVPMIPGVYPRLELLQWIAQDDSNTEENLRGVITGPPGFGPIFGLATYKGIVICCRDFDELGNDSRIYRSTPGGWEQIPMPVEARLGGAKYNFVEYNFYGDDAKLALYGADGKNKAFEISGLPHPGTMTYTEIDTVAVRGVVTYYPQRVAAHAMHLFLAFAGGWVQYSGIGNPFSDDPNDGAGGISYPGDITNMLGVRDNALAITTREGMFMLYGTSESDWKSDSLSTQGDGVGGLPDTMVSGAGTFIADRGGIFRMESIASFGNFATTALSRPIQTLYNFLATTVVGAVIRRDRGTFRLYFAGGEWISMTFGPESIEGFGYGRLAVQPRVIGYGTIGANPGSQREAVFVGGEDGMVYQLDSGDSFDGEDMPYALRFHFDDGGNMRQMKRWRKAIVEFRAPAQFPLLTNVIFDYGSPNTHIHDSTVNNIESAGGVWDVDRWGEFYWLGKYMSEGEIHINGQGRSVSLMLYGEGRVPSFVIEGYTLHYSPRRLVL